MKLNVGCGHDYLDGYLNVDISADSLADAVMEAHDLQVTSAAVDAIVAAQLIEHLGFFKGKYFLSECFRVLRPGGTLRLETPHPERSFEIFLTGDRAARESALTWLYGAETAHMQHRFCFPLELLRELASETGFELLHHESFLYQDNRPALRLILKKPADCAPGVFMAELRKRLVSKGIPAFDDEFALASQEELLARLAGALHVEPLETLQLAINSAEIVREFLALRSATDDRAGEAHAVAARLAELRFQDLLLAILKECRKGAGRQEEAYQETLRQGRVIVSTLLAGESEGLAEVNEERIPAFTAAGIKVLADKRFARGRKEFLRGEYEQALASFDESARLFRDNPFTWWHLARLHALDGNAAAARLAYEMALAALDVSSAEVQRAHRDALMAELNGGFSGEPIAAAAPTWTG
jgi:predicted SAM-dependent methyltransferase